MAADTDLTQRARAVLADPRICDEDRESLARSHEGYVMGRPATSRIASYGLGLILDIEHEARTDLGREVARLLANGGAS